MSKQMNIPPLRFPEFKGEWERKKLGEICKMQAGKFVNASDISESDEVNKYPCYGGNGLRGYTKTYNQDGKFSLIGRQGAHCGNVNLANGKFYATEHAVVVNLFDGFDTDYIYFILGNLNLNQYSTGLAQPGLSVQNIEKVETYISPTLPEQTKIASFLTAVDEKIQALKKKHSLLAQYKKGVMQKLFCLHHDSLDLHDDHDFENENQEKKSRQSSKSPKSRFRQEDGSEFPEWEVKKLGKIGETYGGLSGKSKENFGTGKPYIQYKQIFDDSKIDVSRFELVEIKEDENQNRVQFGDVFFTVSSETPNEIGMSSVLLDEIRELYLNSFCFGFRANSLTELSPYFSRYLFRSENFRNEIIKLAQGSTRYNMSKLQLLKIEILLPCLAEQTKIANFLSAIDEKINHTETQITQMETWKKGLLQKMFV